MKRVWLAILVTFYWGACVANDIELYWCGAPPTQAVGQSWGVPFLPGENRGQVFCLQNETGDCQAVQQWPMAYWADGSIKWLGVAASFEAGKSDQSWRLVQADQCNRPAPSSDSLRIHCNEQQICIVNGDYRYVLSRQGEALFKEISYRDTCLLSGGYSLMNLEDRSRAQEGWTRRLPYRGRLQSVELEQSGPLRAVVKVEGRHFPLSDSLSSISLPFCIRLYVYYGQPELRLVHSVVFDGQQDTDFIASLGLRFDLPLREEVHNRHVIFSGDLHDETAGLWHEPIQPLVGRRVLRSVRSEQRPSDYPIKQVESSSEESLTLYERQMQFQRIANRSAFDAAGQSLLNDWAVWDDYKLTQLLADGFSIFKRTHSQAPWLFADGGHRASGCLLAGDVSGGVLVGMKDFWQSHPSSIELTGARSQQASLTCWFWSPDAPAMDLRHYDSVPHGLNAAYEDIQEGLSTPYGIARTHELSLLPMKRLPNREYIAHFANHISRPSRLMVTPSYLHQSRAFGRWSLPANAQANDTLQWIERQLEDAFSYYQQAIDDHRWYGFWNYGDVMHTYDPTRHAWLYDVGGFAWANTELAPEMCWWYYFLRSGRSDVFVLAEAMSRHTAEVDAYHLGPLKGLGSRHNVSHWGCGAKEARIGQAAWKRFYYYLTTDERMGDLMHETADADFAMVEWDPLRLAKPRSRFPSQAPARLRWGPDWTSFVGNWFAEWERTLNPYYRQKILTGFDCLAAMPDGLYTGLGPLGYYPETGRLVYDGPPGACDRTNHLATIMGGFEVINEVLEALPHEGFSRCWLNYCLHYSLPADDPIKTDSTRCWGNSKQFYTPRLTAYAAYALRGDSLLYRRLKQCAWDEFLQNYSLSDALYRADVVDVPSVLTRRWENPYVGTNGCSQWGLNAIFMMELLRSLP